MIPSPTSQLRVIPSAKSVWKGDLWTELSFFLEPSSDVSAVTSAGNKKGCEKKTQCFSFASDLAYTVSATLEVTHRNTYTDESDSESEEEKKKTYAVEGAPCVDESDGIKNTTFQFNPSAKPLAPSKYAEIDPEEGKFSMRCRVHQDTFRHGGTAFVLAVMVKKRKVGRIHCEGTMIGRSQPIA